MKMGTKKRAYERTTLDMKICFVHSNTKYSGTIKDISHNGMFIVSDTALPFNSKFDLHLPFRSKLIVYISFNNYVIGVPVRVTRLELNGSSFKGMGVSVLDSSQSYENFLSDIPQAGQRFDHLAGGCIY